MDAGFVVYGGLFRSTLWDKSGTESLCPTFVPTGIMGRAATARRTVVERSTAHAPLLSSRFLRSGRLANTSFCKP